METETVTVTETVALTFDEVLNCVKAAAREAIGDDTGYLVFRQKEKSTCFFIVDNLSSEEHRDEDYELQRFQGKIVFGSVGQAAILALRDAGVPARVANKMIVLRDSYKIRFEGKTIITSCMFINSQESAEQRLGNSIAL
jgi:hypothetical protein